MPRLGKSNDARVHRTMRITKESDALLAEFKELDGSSNGKVIDEALKALKQLKQMKQLAQ
ncbi:hypothetical protein [Bacillus toyonensis]|uniref:hypothetical protein n=1 Tax=Bacillus toyonensis TaxID=155322 RepID=UPI001C0C12ED|nr:hypothetical protein [Bacillus toyonensis]MBU4642508.1 hypothetical protein [Bacillus toyonensis]